MVTFTELQWLCINIVGSYKICLTVCSLDILLQLAVEPELWHDTGTELSVLRWSCSSAHSTVQSSFLQQRALVPNVTVTHTARIQNSIWSYSVWATTRLCPVQYDTDFTPDSWVSVSRARFQFEDLLPCTDDVRQWNRTTVYKWAHFRRWSSETCVPNIN